MDKVRAVFISVVRSLQGLLIAHVVGIVGEVGRLGIPFACWSATALMWDLVMIGACSTDRSMFGLRWIPNQLLRRLVLSCLALSTLVSSSGYYLRGGLFLLRVLSLRNRTIWYFLLCLSVKAVYELVSWVAWIWRQQVYTFAFAARVVWPYIVLFTCELITRNEVVAQGWLDILVWITVGSHTAFWRRHERS